MTEPNLSLPDIPLVSVIVRSMARPELNDALNSIEAQTYSNIEVILIDVIGNHPAQNSRRSFPIHCHSTGKPLGRGEAANLGLMHSRGEFLIFLDDDDYFAPQHIANLVGTLARNPGVLAAYSGAAVVDETAENIIGYINEPFNRLRLMHKNYIPIHALLFHRSLMAKGCSFDEALIVYEDWDFWIQLSLHTHFIHLPTIGAYYRSQSSSSGAGAGINSDPSLKAAGGQDILNKWHQMQSDLILHVRSLLERGLKAQRVGSDQEARKIYQEILSIQPDNVNALNLLGMIFYEEKRYDVAKDLIQQAARINGQASGVLLNLGLVLQALDMKQEALESYRRVLAIDAKNVQAQKKLLELLTRHGE